MKIILRSLLVIALLASGSCATIISGSRQIVQFNSDPEAATVYINEVEIGKTPVQKKLKRNQKYQLLLKLEGYQPYETKLERKFNGWYIGNLLFGGIIGLVVDPITGAMYKLEPEEIDGVPKSGTTYYTEDGDLLIQIKMINDPNMEQIGQLEKENRF